MSDIDAVLAAMAGKEITGGCLDCGAVQKLVRQAHGVYVVVVAHDDSCPTYMQIVRERGRW